MIKEHWGTKADLMVAPVKNLNFAGMQNIMGLQVMP